MKIGKILIANRGEIAVRICKTCQELQIQTVSVYSDADAGATHTLCADESIYLGPSEPAKSYLSIEKLIRAAQATGCDAIHPGYGFLSENPDFSAACRANSIIFIGPTAEAMRLLGDKISAKCLAVQAGVPIVPGFFEPGATIRDLADAADKVGYPVMLKASAGGGGRGMRVVRSAAELEPLFQIASKEAANAFGNRSMMLEKLILSPRHVEVQIAGDHHGTISTLFERECTVQRRNQKMLEEAPAPAVESGLVDWWKIRKASIDLARAAQYTNLGTVEFVVDGLTGEFYFLEVNARIQVEHPVTELCTGVDLVAQQIRIAEGRPLSFSGPMLQGDRSAIQAHAIEVRILAENPDLNFQPSAGKILAWHFDERPGIRLDTGFKKGDQVSEFYDSMLAKVISRGETRHAAIEKLTRALEAFHILGISTNIGFLLEVLASPEFISGKMTTGFVEELIGRRKPAPIPDELSALIEYRVRDSGQASPDVRRSSTPAWNLTDNFRIGNL
jgi:acetyl/propionyl-CoA carboxylase alpha subunit